MIHVNFNTNRIDENNSIGDQDTVVLTGAPNQLVANIRQLINNTVLEQLSTPSSVAKIPLNRYAIKTTFVQKPMSIAPKVQKLQDKGAAVEKMSAAIAKQVNNSLASLRKQLASAFIADASFLEDLRLTLQCSTSFNPNRHTITTRNVKAALALYSAYDTSATFSSAEGAETIKTLVNYNQDGVARLGNDLNLVSSKGQARATRYYFTKAFEQALIKVLHNGKHDAVADSVDVIQDEIDSH